MTRRIVLLWAVLVVQTSSWAAAQVTLTPKFEEGTAFRRQEALNLDQTLSLNGQDLKSSTTNTITFNTSYGQRNESGEQPVEITFETLVVDVQAPGGLSFQFDSTQPPPASPGNPIVQPYIEMYQTLEGAKLTYTVDQQRKVTAVGGIQEIIRKAPDSATKLLEAELTEDRLKLELQQELDVLPTQPVNPGDVWNRTHVWNIGNGQTLTFENRLEYVGTVEQDGKQLDKIAIRAESVLYELAVGGALPLTLKNSDLKIDASEHTVLFDRERGVAVSVEGKTHITGTLTLTIGTTDLPATLDLTIDRQSALQEAND